MSKVDKNGSLINFSPSIINHEHGIEDCNVTVLDGGGTRVDNYQDFYENVISELELIPDPLVAIPKSF